MGDEAKAIHTRSLSAKDKKTKVACTECKQDVADNSKALSCDLCGAWYHASCVKVDDTLYQALQKEGSKKRSCLHFYCPRPCNELAAKFLNSFMKMDMRMTKLEDKVADIDTRVVKLEASDIDKRVEELEL